MNRPNVMNLVAAKATIIGIVIAVLLVSCNSWFSSACEDTPNGIKCDRDSIQYKAAVKAAEMSSGKKFTPSSEKPEDEKKPREFY